MSLSDERLERLAQAAHELFCADLRARGYRFGPTTDESLRTHSALRPFRELPPDEQEQNRDTVREIPAKLAALGLRLASADGGASVTLSPEELERLAELEHERWVRAKEAAGWRYGPRTDKAARLHHNLVPWADLSEADQEKDRVMVRGIPELVALAGYRVERAATA